jgi:glycosyltransferase involved in cell wall biosynthesis
MIIFNIMLSKNLGGIEQSFLDYNQALLNHRYQVITITMKNAKIIPQLQHNVTNYTIENLGQWDIFSAWKIRALFKKYKPSIIITHGNRAVSLTKIFIPIKKILSVLHNNKINTIKKCINIIIVNKQLKQLIKGQNKSQNITYIPNMITIPSSNDKPYSKEVNKTLTIGSLGRLIYDKAIEDFIMALSSLHQQGISFEVKIAGDGPEKSRLIQLVNHLQLENYVEFLGWVNNKDTFFNQIDIFCLPSRRESFGIVLLEALARHIPIACTNCDGPQEILTDDLNALITPIADHSMLANSLKKLISSPSLREKLSTNGYDLVRTKYSTISVSIKLDKLIKKLSQEL